MAGSTEQGVWGKHYWRDPECVTEERKVTLLYYVNIIMSLLCKYCGLSDVSSPGLIAFVDKEIKQHSINSRS